MEPKYEKIFYTLMFMSLAILVFGASLMFVAMAIRMFF